MYVIASDCVGGYLYQSVDEYYNNPFIWSVICPSDMKLLIDNFHLIDFNNIKLVWSELFPNCYKIRIDGKIHIHYPHNVYKKDAAKIYKANGNNYWCNAGDLTLSNYKKRLARADMKNLRPTFIITQHDTLPFGYTESVCAQFNYGAAYPIISLSNAPALNTETYSNIHVPEDMLNDDTRGRTNRIFEYAKDSILSIMNC